MLLHDDVVADREPEAGTLACWLRREERIEQLFPYLGWDACAVVANSEADSVTAEDTTEASDQSKNTDGSGAGLFRQDDSDPKGYAEAAKLLRVAADRGDTNARLRLAAREFSSVEQLLGPRSNSHKPHRVGGLIDIAPKPFGLAQTGARWPSECYTRATWGGR